MTESTAIAELKRKHRALVADLVAADEHVKEVRDQIRVIDQISETSYPVARLARCFSSNV